MQELGPNRLRIKSVENPRSDENAVSFDVGFESERDEPVTLQMVLPFSAAVYIAHLTWQEWETIVAWMQWKHLENTGR